MKHHRRFFLALSLTTLARTAVATVTVPITLEALTARSDDVIVGTVRRASSQWDGARIFTDYEIQVSATLRGRSSPGGSLLVRLPGGVVGRIGQSIAGVPTPEVGETYVFFLQNGSPGRSFLSHLTASVVPVALAPSDTLPVRVNPDPSLVSLRPGTSLDAMARSVMAVGR